MPTALAAMPTKIDKRRGSSTDRAVGVRVSVELCDDKKSNAFKFRRRLCDAPAFELFPLKQLFRTCVYSLSNNVSICDRFRIMNVKQNSDIEEWYLFNF